VSAGLWKGVGTFLLNGVPQAAQRLDVRGEGGVGKGGRERGKGGQRVMGREWGLPEGKFVFGYFGDLLYVDHACWHAWMEILRSCRPSVYLSVCLSLSPANIHVVRVGR
jgi:hypothetical protein